MTRPIYDQPTEEYDASFRGRWQNAGGSVQSLQFAFEAVLRLESYFNESRSWDIHAGRIRSSSLVIHDYGCALGDGTAVLQATFPTAKVTGFDISPEGVRVASARWPTLTFRVGNVEAATERADIIWTSHTLEHLRDAAEVVTRLRSLAPVVVVIVPPIEGEDATHPGAEHFSEWTKRVPEPTLRTFYDTIRANPEEGPGKLLVERSVLMLWD